MKKLMMILAGTALMVTSAPAFAGNDRPIAVGELPATAQQFICLLYTSDAADD